MGEGELSAKRDALFDAILRRDAVMKRCLSAACLNEFAARAGFIFAGNRHARMSKQLIADY